MFIILNILLFNAGCTLNHPVHIQKDSFVLQEVNAKYRVPLPEYHVINVGDTLYSIAFRYSTTVETLAINNGLNPPYVIKAGDKLFLKNPPPKPSSQILTNNTKAASVIRSPESQGARNKSDSKIATTNLKNPIKSEAPVRTIIKAPQAQVKPHVAKTSTPMQWQWPAKGRILASFGGGNGLNQGIDIAGNIGESIVAARDGVVVYAGNGLRGYGKLLIIKHDEVYLSAYAHNHKLLVQEGANVKVGQKIAEMGSSDTDRAKLHFEIRRNGTPVDPKQFLP